MMAQDREILTIDKPFVYCCPLWFGTKTDNQTDKNKCVKIVVYINPPPFLN